MYQEGERIMPKLRSVLIFTNDHCAVFDTNGRQVPALQGAWHEVYESVLWWCDADTKFYDYRTEDVSICAL